MRADEGSAEKNHGSKGRNGLQQRDNAHVLTICNRYLIILIIGLLGHVLIKYFSMEQNIQTAFPAPRAIEENALTTDLTGFEPKSFRIYREGIQQRDIFQPPWDKLKPETTALTRVLPVLHKRIKLIGILLDGDSKAVVEDLKEKQTYFLSQGESIGTALLEDIREDKVIFIYNNERVEMVP